MHRWIMLINFLSLLTFWDTNNRRLLGIITKKDVLRHMKQMDSEDPDAVNAHH